MIVNHSSPDSLLTFDIQWALETSLTNPTGPAGRQGFQRRQVLRAGYPKGRTEVEGPVDSIVVMGQSGRSPKLLKLSSISNLLPLPG